VTGATSTTFDITAGAATHLVFTVEPSNTAAANTITPAVAVSAEDTYDNVDMSFTGSVTVAIGTNPGGGTLSGTATVAAIKGVATFSNLSIDKAGTGYTLTASGSVAGATSTTFDITAGAATQLVFTVAPSNTAAGDAITPAVAVSAEDGHDNVDTAYTANVTVAIGTDPGSGTLSGTATVAAIKGVATFPTLNINKVGNGYTLTAASGSLAGATSTAFRISAGGAANIVVFAGSGQSAAVGQAFAANLQARVTDEDGNNVSGVTVTFTAPGSGASGAFAGSGASVTATTAGNGVATAPQFTANGVVGSYDVTASTHGAAGTASFALKNDPGPSIPTLGGLGFVVLALLLAVAGAFALGRPAH
jgi:hypothetical protein